MTITLYDQLCVYPAGSNYQWWEKRCRDKKYLSTSSNSFLCRHSSETRAEVPAVPDSSRVWIFPVSVGLQQLLFSAWRLISSLGGWYLPLTEWNTVHFWVPKLKFSQYKSKTNQVLNSCHKKYSTRIQKTDRTFPQEVCSLLTWLSNQSSFVWSRYLDWAPHIMPTTSGYFWFSS